MNTDHPTPPMPPAEPQMPPAEPQAPPVTPPPVYYYPPVYYPAPSRVNGLAVTSMILGIISIFFAGVPFGVTAIVLGICSRRGDERLPRMAVAGIICGIIGVIFGLLSITFTIGEMGALLPETHEME
ncbi:MAG: hypothetical protein J6R77_07085 [Clostridia bacterium]|nr:hypothetical protein [Clostridia bacterium]